MELRANKNLYKIFKKEHLHVCYKNYMGKWRSSTHRISLGFNNNQVTLRGITFSILTIEEVIELPRKLMYFFFREKQSERLKSICNFTFWPLLKHTVLTKFGLCGMTCNDQASSSVGLTSLASSKCKSSYKKKLQGCFHFLLFTITTYRYLPLITIKEMPSFIY